MSPVHSPDDWRMGVLYVRPLRNILNARVGDLMEIDGRSMRVTRAETRTATEQDLEAWESLMPGELLTTLEFEPLPPPRAGGMYRKSETGPGQPGEGYPGPYAPERRRR